MKLSKELVSGLWNLLGKFQYSSVETLCNKFRAEAQTENFSEQTINDVYTFIATKMTYSECAVVINELVTQVSHNMNAVKEPAETDKEG